MHRLTSSFILGYHGCDRAIGERLLQGEKFQPSNNDYDWLGPGIYFWEANPHRGYQFAIESSRRRGSSIVNPFVVGAIIDLGLCLVLTTARGISLMQAAFESLRDSTDSVAKALPTNSEDLLRRNLDCAVVQRLHSILAKSSTDSVDTVKGVFTEGAPAYPGAGFLEKTHIQIAFCNPDCIKGVFRVPEDQFRP